MKAGLLDMFIQPLGLDKPKIVEKTMKETLADTALRALGLIYMADVGRSGNPPATSNWWVRSVVQLDARIAQILDQNGLVEGRNKVGGTPAEIRLTKKGAAVARQNLDGMKS